MSKEKLEMLVEGGKATVTPAIAQKLGPMKTNMGEVLQKVNDKTKDFKGMQVPVKLIVDTETKEVEVEVGTPPTTELIKKELNLKKGSPKPDKIKVGNISIEQVIKIAKMKKDSMFINNLKAGVKTVVGSCNSVGVLVEGKPAAEVSKEISEGKYDKEIQEEKIEPSQEKLQLLKEQFTKVEEEQAAELEKLKLEAEEKAAAAEAKPEEGEKPAEAKPEAKLAEKPIKEEKK